MKVILSLYWGHTQNPEFTEVWQGNVNTTGAGSTRNFFGELRTGNLSAKLKVDRRAPHQQYSVDNRTGSGIIRWILDDRKNGRYVQLSLPTATPEMLFGIWGMRGFEPFAQWQPGEPLPEEAKGFAHLYFVRD